MKRLSVAVLAAVAILMAVILAQPALAAAPKYQSPTNPVLHYGNKGKRVRDLQWLLGGHRPSAYRGINTLAPKHVTGSFDKATYLGVRRMKYRLGFPAKAVNGRAGPDFFRILRGRVKRPWGYIARAGQRVPTPVPTEGNPYVGGLIALAKKELGNVESWGDNWGPRVRDYQSATGAYRAAWCVSFVQWLLKQLKLGPIADHTAGVYYMTDWGRARGMVHARPKAGAIVLFQDGRRVGHGHAGLVIKTTAHGFVSIEGNASNAVRERYHNLVDRQPLFLWLPQVQSEQPALIKRVFKTRWVTAACIAWYESRYNPRAVNYNRNGSVDRGLFQINSIHRGWVNLGRLYDAVYNSAVAFKLSRGGTNWWPWSTYSFHGYCR